MTPLQEPVDRGETCEPHAHDEPVGHGLALLLTRGRVEQAAAHFTIPVSTPTVNSAAITTPMIDHTRAMSASS